MTPYEEELLTRYLPHLNVLGEDGDYADFEDWHQVVRYANGPGAQRTVEEPSKLRCKDVLEAARAFNRPQGKTKTDERCSRPPQFAL